MPVSHSAIVSLWTEKTLSKLEICWQQPRETHLLLTSRITLPQTPVKIAKQAKLRECVNSYSKLN